MISFYNLEYLWFPNTKGIKAVVGGRKRMTIKLMTTRQHHSRSVDKRTVFILWFSNHAKKKITGLNQERCWGFGDGFFEAWRGKHGRKGSSVSSWWCHWGFHNSLQNLLTACHTEMLLVSNSARANLPASPPNKCMESVVLHLSQALPGIFPCFSVSSLLVLPRS